MPLTVKQLVRRHGALVAAVTALAVGATMVLIDIVSWVIGFISVAPYLDGQPYAIDVAGLILRSFPFALGFFLSLWIIAPIAEELGIAHVITRAVLATGVGSTVTFIALAIVAILESFSWTGAIFGQSFPLVGLDGGYAVGGLGRSLTGALLLLVQSLPLGVLAGVLLWLWRKDHPPKQPLSGLIDEV
jgi:hypothetical protein